MPEEEKFLVPGSYNIAPYSNSLETDCSFSSLYHFLPLRFHFTLRSISNFYRDRWCMSSYSCCGNIHFPPVGFSHADSMLCSTCSWPVNGLLLLLMACFLLVPLVTVFSPHVPLVACFSDIDLFRSLFINCLTGESETFSPV